MNRAANLFNRPGAQTTPFRNVAFSILVGSLPVRGFPNEARIGNAACLCPSENIKQNEASRPGDAMARMGGLDIRHIHPTLTMVGGGMSGNSFDRDTMMDTRGNDMKEVLTKSFWQGVKKTFYEALEGPPLEDNASQAPAADNLKAPSSSDAPPPSAKSEQN